MGEVAPEQTDLAKAFDRVRHDLLVFCSEAPLNDVYRLPKSVSFTMHRSSSEKIGRPGIGDPHTDRKILLEQSEKFPHPKGRTTGSYHLVKTVHNPRLRIN